MEQIDIKELSPFMKPGWVACDKKGTWCWFSKKPHLCINDEVEWLNCWMPAADSTMQLLFVSDIAFREIKKPEDWITSLMKVGE